LQKPGSIGAGSKPARSESKKRMTKNFYKVSSASGYKKAIIRLPEKKRRVFK
jgi:hypothetical protein